MECHNAENNDTVTFSSDVDRGLAKQTLLAVSPALGDKARGILEGLREAGLSIITAESCTAGMVAAVLSRADGAGEVLHGGFVTYTKVQKTAALGVSLDLLREHGAVNEEVVREMAAGALKNSFAKLSLAVSGVLGPEKDEDGNSVGLVYFCCLIRDQQPVVVRAEFGNREPEELLQLTIARAFDVIESCIRKFRPSSVSEMRQARLQTVRADKNKTPPAG